MDESENSSLEILSNNSSSNDNCERKGTVNRAANKDLKVHNSVIKPTEEEYELYIEMFSELSDVLSVQINCTACGRNLNKIVATGNAVFYHPQLRVLMCNKCHTFYGDGEFSVDEDGSVNYCRWCGQGGTLYCCSECTSAFCKACLKRNLSKVDLEITESEDWKCLMCNCKPIWKNRSICWAAQQYISEFQRKKKKEKLANLQKLIKSKEESSQSKKRKRNSYSRRTSRRDSSTKNNSVEVICVKTSNDEADSSDVDNEPSKTRSNSHKKYKIDNCSNKKISRNNVNVHAIKVEASESDDSTSSDSTYINKNTARSSYSRSDFNKGSARCHKGKRDMNEGIADQNRNAINNKNKTETSKYTSGNSSETSSDKASNGNTSKIRKIDHFEKVSSLTQDMKAAKKTSVWISEYLKDIISIGELISNEAKKMLETNVSISKLAKCSQVNKIIHKINILTNLSCKNLKKVKCISNAAHIHWVEKVKSQISTPKAKAKITNTDEKTSNSEEDDSNCEEHCVVKSEDTIQQCILSDIIGNKEHEENAKNNSPSSHNMNQNACFQHDKSNIKEFEETDTRVSNGESENNTSDRLHSLESNRNESDEKNNIGNKHEKKRREICNTSSKKIACERLDSSEEKIESDKSESDKEKAMKHSDEHLTAKEISESTLSKNNSLCEAEIAEEKNEIKKHDLHVANILSLAQADDNEANNFIQKVDKNNIEENNSDSACEIKNNAHATEKSEKERIKLLHESEYNDINSEIKTDDFVSISNEQFDCVSNVESSSLPAEQCPKLTEKCSDAKRELLESSMDESLSDETSDGEYVRKPNLHKSSEQKSCPERKQRRKTKNLGEKSDLKLNHNLSVTSSSDSDCSSEKLDKEKDEEEGVSYSEACQKCFVLLERLDSNLSEAVKQKDLKDEGKTLDECTNNVEECYPEKLHKIDEEVNSVKEDSENDLKRLFNMTSLKARDRLECNLSTKTNLKEKDKKKKKVNEEDVSLLTIHNKVDEEANENGSNSCNQDSDLDIHKSFQDLEATLDIKKSKFTKEMLLLVNTTDEDTSDNQSSLKKKHRRKKKSKDHLENKENIKKEEDADEITPENDSPDSDKEKNKSKNKWRHDKLLKLKLSETDTSDEERLWKKKKDEYEKKIQENNSDEPALKSRSKRRKNIIDSNSDDEQLEGTSDSNGSIEMFQVKRKKRQRSDTDQSCKNGSATDGSIGKKKIKRKRIRNLATDNSDNSSVELELSPKAEGTPSKGRKNIRRLLKDGNVAEATKQAAREEEERRKRIAEKQKLYYSLYKEVESESLDKLVLDFHPDTKEEIVKVHENLVKKLKPHQVKGVKFMWDACFESIEQIKKTKGSGCILAHCMGLGKTFQVVTLIHTLLTHEITNVKTVLVVCPLNTVLNWVNEFSVWLKDTPENQTIEVFEISKFKQNYERLYKLKEWQESGGVMVLGYEMFRNLTNPAVKRVRKKLVEGFQSTLVDPGPDLIVCDEGHLLKNEDSAISKAMRKIKSLRRIVLTGTPLQNNLAEYHCMVQFVKPNLLGNRKEFNNRFVHPICNGQFEDSTAHDVRVMKRRAHVLHKMLEDSVQRYDYSVLTPFLPPKQEYVISVKLSEVQIKAYQYYLENFSARAGQELDGVLKPKGAKLFSDFQSLQQIWTHPRVMLMNAQKKEKLAEKKRLYESDSEGSLRDFITDGSDESSSNSGSSNSTSSNSTEVLPKKVTRSQIDKQISDCEIDEIAVSNGEEAAQKQSQWWEQFVTDDDFEDLRLSGKLVLLFSILQECEKIGDKLLVFSQSLFSLDLIEYFLNKIDNAAQKNESDPSLNNHSGSWTFGLDYFRLDGSTSGENRNQWCKIFNKEDNHRARLFLISTRAGGLGINLVAANRVVIFDASWNPSHDVQSIFRIYRFGQKKPCYVYRFLAQGTMEEKIYDRQVSKLSLACRVVDEHQIERHYNMSDLRELYQFNPEQVTKRPTPILPKDRLFADLLREHEQWIVTYHEHDSLLENKHEEELNEEERKAAWEDFENEKKGIVYAQSFVGPNYQPFNLQALRDLIWKENPSISEEQLQERIKRVLHYMAQYQSTNLLGSVPDGKTQDQKFNYNEHQMTNIVESNPYMQYSGSPYFQQMANVPTVSNTNVLSSQQLPTMVPAHNEVYNTMISVDAGKVTSASAPRIKVKDLSLMKVVSGTNSGVLLPNPYNQSINAATWSAQGSELVAQHTSEGNKIPGNITNKVISDDSIEIIE